MILLATKYLTILPTVWQDETIFLLRWQVIIGWQICINAEASDSIEVDTIVELLGLRYFYPT